LLRVTGVVVILRLDFVVLAADGDAAGLVVRIAPEVVALLRQTAFLGGAAGQRDGRAEQERAVEAGRAGGGWLRGGATRRSGGGWLGRGGRWSRRTRGGRLVARGQHHTQQHQRRGPGMDRAQRFAHASHSFCPLRSRTYDRPAQLRRLKSSGTSANTSVS